MNSTESHVSINSAFINKTWGDLYGSRELVRLG